MNNLNENMNILEIIGERDWSRDKADCLWQVLVMLKRELDKHETKEGFLELPESAWNEAVERVKKYQPH